MKFKVGDKVKLIKSDYYTVRSNLVIGDIYTICNESVSPWEMYKVQEDVQGFWFNVDYFDLYPTVPNLSVSGNYKPIPMPSNHKILSFEDIKNSNGRKFKFDGWDQDVYATYERPGLGNEFFATLHFPNRVEKNSLLAYMDYPSAHFEWLDEEIKLPVSGPAQKNKCTCSLDQVWKGGCKCGGI